ncbi:universal stress protein [Rhizobiales bacterium 3FA27D7]|jgi:nucleotide-binding universal stress UspA family protein|uniref:universal stress protein n=1 Tax=Mesorhizobium sp. 2RAF21 TaxID=3232995 RepID=UPI0010F56FC4
MYKHILIATDGSELAAKGVDQGLALAVPLHASVTVLTVTRPLPPQVARAAVAGGVHDPVIRYDEQIDEHMRMHFTPVKQRASQHGITVELVHEIDDSPAGAIVRTARLRNCDLIVMSSHGRRGVDRLILGSQTAEVLAHTILPVLVVR